MRGFAGLMTDKRAIPMAVQMAVPTVEVARQDKLFVVSDSKQSDGMTARISEALGNVVNDNACPFRPEKAIPDQSIIAVFSDRSGSSLLSKEFTIGGVSNREGNVVVVAVSRSNAIVLSLVFEGRAAAVWWWWWWWNGDIDVWNDVTIMGRVKSNTTWSSIPYTAAIMMIDLCAWEG